MYRHAPYKFPIFINVVEIEIPLAIPLHDNN